MAKDMAVSCFWKVLLLYVVLQMCCAGRFLNTRTNKDFLQALLQHRIYMFTRGVDSTFFNTPSGRSYLRRNKKSCRIDEMGQERMIGAQIEKDSERTGILFWVEQYMEFRHPPTIWTPVCIDNYSYKNVFVNKPVLSLRGKRRKLCFQNIAISCTKREVKNKDQDYFKMPSDKDDF